MLIIPLVALAIDRVLFWMQRQLFPHLYGGAGLAGKAVRMGLHGWDDLKRVFFHYEPPRNRRQPFRPRRSAASRRAEPRQAMSDAAATPAATPAARRRRHGRGARPRPHAGADRAPGGRRLSSDVTKTYNAGRANAFTAISDVTFVVEDLPDKGEFVCVLGPSGCGKSTILRLIAGLEPQHPATSGEVLVLGQPVVGPGADRGMVFQDYTSFDHRTVLDNITFGLECQGVPRRAAVRAGPRVDRQGRPERGPGRSTSIRTSSPAACGSGWPSPAR